jgi:hypothetical protein
MRIAKKKANHEKMHGHNLTGHGNLRARKIDVRVQHDAAVRKLGVHEANKERPPKVHILAA